MNRIQRVVIVGAGGLAHEVAEAILARQGTGAPIQCEAMFVEEGYSAPLNPLCPILREWRNVTESSASVVLGIGDAMTRKRLATMLDEKIAIERWATVVHPSAAIGSTVEIRPGAMLIGQMSLTARIVVGRHALLNPGCTIAHDCIISDFASLSPSVSLAGHVQIGEGAFLGTGVIVGPKVQVGADAIIGAGAVVLRDVLPGEKVYGVPARSVTGKGREM